MVIFREVKQEEKVIARIAAAQREELEQVIPSVQVEAGRVTEEALELAGEVPFCGVGHGKLLVAGQWEHPVIHHGEPESDSPCRTSGLNSNGRSHFGTITPCSVNG